MLQALIEDRFKVMLHRETRQLPVFELTVAKGGLKLRPSKEGSCTPYSMDSPPPAAPAPGSVPPTFCGFPRSGFDGLHRTLEGTGVSIATLATNLSRLELHRTIIDRTGLPGTFDVHLKWSSDAPAGPGGPGTAPAPNLTEAPSIFTAVQQQLGLKLESTKGPVEVLIIDHVEKPGAN